MGKQCVKILHRFYDWRILLNTVELRVARTDKKEYFVKNCGKYKLVRTRRWSNQRVVTTNPPTVCKNQVCVC